MTLVIISLMMKQEKYLTNFKSNLIDGIAYYQKLFSDKMNTFEVSNELILKELEQLRNELLEMKIPVLQTV